MQCVLLVRFFLVVMQLTIDSYILGGPFPSNVKLAYADL